MASTPRLIRWRSWRSSCAQRAQAPHNPSPQTSGASGPCESHELLEAGVWPALEPARRDAGLLLRPRFDEADAGDVGEHNSIRPAAARRCRVRRRSLRRYRRAYAAIRIGRRRAA